MTATAPRTDAGKLIMALFDRPEYGLASASTFVLQREFGVENMRDASLEPLSSFLLKTSDIAREVGNSSFHLGVGGVSGKIYSPQGHLQQTAMGGGLIAAVNHVADLLKRKFASVVTAQFRQVGAWEVSSLAALGILPMALSAIVLKVYFPGLCRCVIR